mgnify:CR=1 FL=1
MVVVSSDSHRNEVGTTNASLFTAWVRGPAAAATMAGTLEIAFFHPFDTIAKRLMSHQGAIRGAGLSETVANLNRVIFKSKAEGSVVEKIRYMYPGSTYALMYKVLQRVYKFAGQPIVRDGLNKVGVPQYINPIFGNKSKMMTESVAGSMIGIGEIVLLPLDRLKILAQTNPETLQNRSLVSIFRQEGWGLYAGAGVTAMRNAPGSFFLFGGAAFTKDIIFGLNDYSQATFAQNMLASTVGSVLSIAVTNPMDVIKTRVQNKDFAEKTTAAKVLRQLLRQEGVSAFFKGLAPKVTASAPKLVFSYTMTEFFINVLKPKKKPTTVAKTAA